MKFYDVSYFGWPRKGAGNCENVLTKKLQKKRNKRAMMALDRSPELRRPAKISHESDGISRMRNAD